MEILYSDREIAVCVKPVGMDAEHEVPQALKDTLGGEVFPLHRLDKNVGGVMVYARTKAAAASLSKAIQDGAMVKEYVAKVHGAPPRKRRLDGSTIQRQSQKQGICGEESPGRCERGTAVLPPFGRRSRTRAAVYRSQPSDPGAVFQPWVPIGWRP